LQQILGKGLQLQFTVGSRQSVKTYQFDIVLQTGELKDTHPASKLVTHYSHLLSQTANCQLPTSDLRLTPYA
jgi:hypothetical protein